VRVIFVGLGRSKSMSFSPFVGSHQKQAAVFFASCPP
jgi:hypothetical protein